MTYDVNTPEGKAFVLEACNRIFLKGYHIFMKGSAKELGNSKLWQEVANELTANTNYTVDKLNLVKKIWAGVEKKIDRAAVPSLMKELKDSGWLNLSP